MPPANLQPLPGSNGDPYLLVFGDEGDLPASWLADYLTSFETVYRAIVLSGLDRAAPNLTVDAMWELIIAKHLEYAKQTVSDGPSEEGRWSRNGKETLQIRSISKNSPMEITLCGISVAISVAVILSGGKIEASVKGFKCHLPALGKGIEALRKALKKKSD